ncbi:MAG: InlB B-repeat-containing protein, partial [Clostridia bacterium]|nr:InlB B-repeat-containing protein [Clostridia bacterium]
GVVFNADEGYLEIQNTAAAPDTGFEFQMQRPVDVDASGCQYLEFDIWVNDTDIFYGIDQRIFLGSSSQLGGLASHQCAQATFMEYLALVNANEWAHVRIPFSAFTKSSNNPNGLELDLETLCMIHYFFRFNGDTALEGYNELNPAIVRIRNITATQYEGTPTFVADKTAYTVTFVDANGEEIESQTIHFGRGAVAPVTPVVDGKTFIGWDTDYSFVTGDITVKALYRDDTEAVLKAEAEAALAAIGTVTKDNAAEQAVLVNAARQAIATLTDKVDGAKADALAGYAKLTAAEKALADLTGYSVTIDGVKDDKYTESINLKDYTTLLGVDKLPDVAVDGKAYMTWDDEFVYVYIEYPEAVGRIEARIDTDPSLNTGDYRGKFATYTDEQSDELIIRAADGTIRFNGGKGDATMAAGLNADGKKTLEFAWPLTGEELFGLSVVASHAGDNAYYVSSYAGWCDYNSLHYYYLMTRAELIAKAEELIGAIGEVTEDNIYDVEEAISEARTLIDNALASYEDFSTDVIENYLDLRKAEHVYNYYFAGNTGTAPSLPPLEEIDVMLSTESEDLNINMLSKVITVNTKMTVAELIAALEADEGVELTIVNVDGRVVKGSTYVRDTYRLFATIADKGQATYALLYLGDEVTEPEELEPLPEVSEPEDEESTGGSTSDDSGAENPGTGVTTYVFVAVLMMLAAGTVLVLTRKQRVR